MEIWGFIKPDKKVLSLFSLLFVLSVILSIFIPGHPGYRCSEAYYYRYGCSRIRGIGLPFAWADLYFVGRPSPECITPPYTNCRAEALPPESIIFDPINLVLDIVILYIVALLIVRTYERYFRKKKRK